MSAEACIIDGYVDEPACLGVPPYISPYIRTVAGVLKEEGYLIRYLTIDQIRDDPSLMISVNRTELAVMIAGMTVPGKYLGGSPATASEIMQIAKALDHPVTCLGGPILFGYSPKGGAYADPDLSYGFDHHLQGSLPESLHALLQGGDAVGSLSYPDEDRWSVLGADIITQHPRYPHVMCELETGRGCSRCISGGCSFCTEPFYGRPVYRDEAGVRDEVRALYEAGARHFRLGRQADLLAYKAGDTEYPTPRISALRELFAGIRAAAPDLRTLHIDNINPGTIARHPDESRGALQEIITAHTPGDIAAFGMETADPAVIEANNLKAEPEEVLDAIRIVNELGSKRKEGIPELLPGLNFIAGLAGESPDTYRLNKAFLQSVLDEGLLVRRVNIRQLMPFAGTVACTKNALPADHRLFQEFKEWTRKHFDLPMLRRVFPTGTILRDCIVEEPGQLSLCRQMGSYPILVGLPLEIPDTILDLVVVDHGMRSLTGLPYPIPVNSLPARSLKWIPNLSKKMILDFNRKRPFRTFNELNAVTRGVLREDMVSFR